MNRFAALLVCARALTGCADWPHVSPGYASSREERESRQVLELLAYAQKVAALSGDEQQRELNASNQIFSKDRGPYSRVRLALVLSIPGTPFSDETKAAGLLEPVSTGAAGPMQQFAGLLYVQIGERLRDQRRAVQYKEQLDALKDVERKIIERDQVRTR